MVPVMPCSNIPPPPADPWENVDPEGGENGWDGWLRRLTPQQLAHLYEGLHRLSFSRVLEVDCVEGEYPPERWEEWEKNLDQAPPAEVPPDFPPPGYPDQSPSASPWSLPPAPGGPEDDIPF